MIFWPNTSDQVTLAKPGTLGDRWQPMTKPLDADFAIGYQFHRVADADFAVCDQQVRCARQVSNLGGSRQSRPIEIVLCVETNF